MSREELRGQGIAAMGRVARDADGYTVYSTEAAPEVFRVWNDEHAGERCTCDRFNRAFRSGGDYRCEHIFAVSFWLEPPDDEVAAVAEQPSAYPPLRRVV